MRRTREEESIDVDERALAVATRVAERLATHGETLAVAESATGGLILSLLSDVPGASHWLRGGIVAYTNDVKVTVLGVPHSVVTEHGSVSAATAGEMARGARRLFTATWAIGETGIAGPQTNRRSRKPAGLTFIAVTGERDGTPVERVERHLIDAPGSRISVKRDFAEKSLSLLLETLEQHP